MSILYAILAILVLDVVNCQMEAMLATLANVPEDGLLNCTELSAKYGHEAETYYITTKDGYILELHNIRGNRKNPILLVHGIFDSSDGWVIRGNTSLAIILANNGYDVWLLNFRGNRYARKHKTLNPDTDSQFWDYSANEYGTYDLPACIDFVLNVTGEQQLSIIAFSEGTTAVFILCSTQEEYNDKIKLFIALAPVVFLENVRSGLAIIIKLSPIINFFLPPSVQEIVGFYSLTKAILNLLCTQLVIGYELCYLGGFSSVSGDDPIGVDRKFFKIAAAHIPAGTSRKNLMHFAQMSLRQSFAQYDYGPTKNLNVYRSFTPPVYDVKKVTMKIVLFSGINDPVSTLKDVELLKPQLSNLVSHVVVEREMYTHLDHLWADDAATIEYPIILDVLAKY